MTDIDQVNLIVAFLTIFNLNLAAQDEAERWKERGNQISKEANSVDLAIACYSLALNFTPAQEKFLKAAILSNRSMMYRKQDKVDEALNDAQECINNKPDWPKVRYKGC